MAAPIGNRFWEQRSSHGRKPIFEDPEQLWEAACEYFEWVTDNPLEGNVLILFKLSLKVTKQQFRARSKRLQIVSLRKRVELMSFKPPLHLQI